MIQLSQDGINGDKKNLNTIVKGRDGELEGGE
jgi:hypothetical protein